MQLFCIGVSVSDLLNTFPFGKKTYNRLQKRGFALYLRPHFKTLILRNMKKAIFTLAIAALGLTAGAQDKKGSDQPLRFSAGVELGLPISSGFKATSSFGFGASVQGEYAAAEQVGITLNAGFMTFPGKTESETIFGQTYETKTNTTFIPVLAGAKVYFAEKFFGHVQGGMTFITSKTTQTAGGQSQSASASTSAFTYAPGIGYKAAENFEVEVKYQAYSKGGTSSFIGLRAAYIF